MLRPQAAIVKGIDLRLSPITTWLISAKFAPSGAGLGCLAGIATGIAVPVIVFCGILIANSMNPRCGTPGDAGGCEMGLASGTISAIVIGLGLGILIGICTAIVRRRSRR
jgi:hypothetical protein